MKNAEKISAEEFFKLEEEGKKDIIRELLESGGSEKIIEILSSVNAESLSSGLLSCLAAAYNNEVRFQEAMNILDSIPEEERDAKWYYRYGYSNIFSEFPVGKEASDKAVAMFETACRISTDDEVKDWCAELISAFNLSGRLFAERDNLPNLYEAYINSVYFAENNIAPLSYWEEYSYMSALVPEGYEIPEDIFERIQALEGIEIKYKSLVSKDNPGKIGFILEGMDFEAGYFIGEFSADSMIQLQLQYFTEEEKENIINTGEVLTLFMKFEGNPKKAYHLQLKLLYAIVPEMFALYDESAERLLNSKWVELAAKSHIVPAPENLYSVQAVSDEDKVWLHSHGLCRCNLHEIEILDSSRDEYSTHYSLLSSYASRLLDKYDDFENDNGDEKDDDIEEEIFNLGMFYDGEPIVATSRIWIEGLGYYPKEILGGFADREESHNSKTNLIFLYGSEEDMNEERLRPVGEFTERLENNPLYYFSKSETRRMSSLARERFSYVERMLNLKQEGKEDIAVLIKLGLETTDSEGKPDKENLEHIWFEIMSLEEDGFRAKLTQEPYNIPNLHEGDEGVYSIPVVSDWIIYTAEGRITPETVYLLDLQ